MPKKTTKSSTKSVNKTNKYLYLVAIVLIGALGFSLYKAFGPKPLGINELKTFTPPSVIIKGYHVYFKDNVEVAEGTSGATWIAPGTYSGTPGTAGRNINGQFIKWGTYGKFDGAEEVARSAAGAAFTAAVYQAQGIKVPAKATNPNDPACKNISETTYGSNQKNVRDLYIKCYTVDINKDGVVNSMDANIFNTVAGSNK